ncbi:MAG: hypothetical protein AAF990_16395 [Bacteroidota bacterium]
MDIPQIKSKLKERLALGINYGLKAAEEFITPASPLRNDLIQLKSQYNDLNIVVNQGTLGYEQIELGLNKIRRALLSLIDRIEAGDSTHKEQLPKLQNNALQHRKQNFFEILRIHFENTQNIKVTLASYSEQPEEQNGREAIAFLYKEIFRYTFRKEHQSNAKADIQAYSKNFFQRRYPMLEVYMKTVGFIIRYILDEEMEQTFYIGVLQSVLSKVEMGLIAYYGISGIEEDYLSLLSRSKLLDSMKPEDFVLPTHAALLSLPLQQDQ